ncbi:MAG: proline--tRNA ligase [Sulfurimonas sp.]|nr:MAG: proline--tRNA ligase [Sulfurimonas sp.]
MRRSKAFIPTTKEVPNDAVLASHIFLSRAGFIAQVSSGLYNFLPLGKRVLKKIETIVNEEMQSIGAQEVELSLVTPVELWQESGRIEKFGKELLRFKDRKENRFVLGPTHEEMMVSLVRNRVSSYKQLPMHLYQIKTKFRDEARPRFGLMRGREFLMKDGYSFHSSEDDLNREFTAVEAAYKQILTRLGLDFRVVEADSGAIGGSGSKELMVIADSGEDTIAICDHCHYAANIEAAVRGKREDVPEAPEATFNRFMTPDVTTIEALASFFKVDPYYLVKTVVKRAVYDDHSDIVLFCLRGSDTLQEVKACHAVHAQELVDVSEEELNEVGLTVGFMGPLNLNTCTIVMDVELEHADAMICGANEKDYHYVGVNFAALKNIPCVDIAEVKEGDRCPHCSGVLALTKGIEVGHIFKLGTTYSSALKAEFLNDKGQREPFIMGTYGMGISRLVAAVIEQHHDDNGCIWTASTAPYLVNVMISNIKDEQQMTFAQTLYEQLRQSGVEVMLDDRKERFGFKMKDAELIGFPYTVIVGKELVNGNIQLMNRATLQKETLAADRALEAIIERVMT